ncbi:hypothetical protein ACHAXA_001468 [Cyclostephanos tholiformis]|uniref:Aspartyl/asparaginy/proline hydroxylase domain-containing protein n=1 Tax=Cyclostephanos tholiformis TaxID=382380 RepID=A0ABD3RZ32_9STRA
MVATPPEEIARQHAEACDILDSGSMACLPRIDYGEIPLRWKVRPTSSSASSITTASNCIRPMGTSDNRTADEGLSCDDGDGEGRSAAVEEGYRYCISSRGNVDVSPIVELIIEGVNDPLVVKDEDGGGGGSAAATRSTLVKTKDGTRNIMTKSSGKRTIATTGGKSTSPTSSKNASVAANAPRKDETSSSRSLWNERYAMTNNVRLTRPSHDAWGIKKIILVFCDDFLNTVYTLPWYQLENDIGKRMHDAIQPILDVLGIQQEQMVRCIFAGMPPGVTIPVHHDTGEWVKHAHRVHVPIIVPDVNRVLFRCGPTVSSLGRVDCSPGHVFEMNNQAKHCATNAHDASYRVHLILDYVEPDFHELRMAQNCPVRRVNLNPGEVVTQTRRSIDRALDAGMREHPSYLIIGAQKAGTTSLYEYINQHPWVVRARRRETHCLDWRWDDTLKSTEERRSRCLGYYHADAMGSYPSLITGDSTPSYLLDYYRVIPRLKEVFSHEPRLIIMVRDPIGRAMSQYAMVTSTDGTPEQLAARGVEWRDKTLEEVLMEDVRNMKDDGLLPYWDMETGTVDRAAYDDFIDTWMEDEAWEKYVTTRIPINTGSYSPLGRGLYALQCRQWFRSFSKDKFLVLRLEDMSSPPTSAPSSDIDDGGALVDEETHDEGGGQLGVQRAVDRVMSHLGLPRFQVADTSRKNSRVYDNPLEGKDELRARLERFFEPHNERFGRMMVEHLGYDEGEWRNVWSYAKVG